MNDTKSVIVAIGVLALIGAKVVAATEARPGIEWERSDLGETAFVPMKSAPFPHPSRDKGYTYNKVTFAREPHYSDSTVALFIPDGYRRTPRVDVLVYLHGWGNNVRKAISQCKLREQIAASGQNIVLVFPEGPRDASRQFFSIFTDHLAAQNVYLLTHMEKAGSHCALK